MNTRKQVLDRALVLRVTGLSYDRQNVLMKKSGIKLVKDEFSASQVFKNKADFLKLVKAGGYSVFTVKENGNVLTVYAKNKRVFQGDHLT